jgi:hypothetical protein
MYFGVYYFEALEKLPTHLSGVQTAAFLGQTDMSGFRLILPRHFTELFISMLIAASVCLFWN